MKNEISQYTEKLIDNKLSEIFKIRIASFISYSTGDTSTRKITAQLLNIPKTDDIVPMPPQIIDDIPLFYFGTNRAQTDYDLFLGDEVLLFFSDRTTDVYRTEAGLVPALEERQDSHSIDYAFAVPVSGFHNKLTQSAVGVFQIKLQPSQKLQLGITATPQTFTIELIQEMYTVFNAMSTLVATDGDTFAASFVAYQTSILAPFLVKLQTLGVVV